MCLGVRFIFEKSDVKTMTKEKRDEVGENSFHRVELLKSNGQGAAARGKLGTNCAGDFLHHGLATQYFRVLEDIVLL